MVKKRHHVAGRFEVQSLRTWVQEEVTSRSTVLEGSQTLWKAFGRSRDVLVPEVPLTLGEDSIEGVEHELHYLALEHHVDRHVG